MYIDGSIRGYLDDLAARKPAPGGGSAAALGAAVGVSLMSMVANYTIGNSKYKDNEKAVAGILLKAEKARIELQDLIDEDVRAYEKLSKGIKEQGKNSAKLDEIYKEAAQPPLKVCETACQSLKLCKDLARYGNKNLVTDTAIAAILLEGAFFSAKFNVYINLKYIKDTEYIGRIHSILSPLENEVAKLKEEILEMCEDAI